MKRSEHALEEFSSGINCSQAVLAEYAEELWVDLEIAQRISCGFGGGMGRMGGTCGAAAGALRVTEETGARITVRQPSAKEEAPV